MKGGHDYGNVDSHSDSIYINRNQRLNANGAEDKTPALFLWRVDVLQRFSFDLFAESAIGGVGI